MANLTLIERLQLVKAGYKAKDIEKMIIEDAANQTDVPPANTLEGSADPAAAKDDKPNSDGNIPNEPNSDGNIPNEPNSDGNKSNDLNAPDYKTQFEKLKVEYEETKKKLDAAQRANISADVSSNKPKVSTAETINNIFREIIS